MAAVGGGSLSQQIQAVLAKAGLIQDNVHPWHNRTLHGYVAFVVVIMNFTGYWMQPLITSTHTTTNLTRNRPHAQPKNMADFRFTLAKTSFGRGDFDFTNPDEPDRRTLSWTYAGEPLEGEWWNWFHSGFPSTHFAGQMSVITDIPYDEATQKGLGIKKEAKYFAWSYPVAMLQDDDRVQQIVGGALAGMSYTSKVKNVAKNVDVDVTCFSQGCFMLFDEKKEFVQAWALRIPTDSEEVNVKFGRRKQMTAKFKKFVRSSSMHWFHHTSLPFFREDLELKRFLWVPPRSVFVRDEDKTLFWRAKEWLIPSEPWCEHGCFAFRCRDIYALTECPENDQSGVYPIELQIPNRAAEVIDAKARK